MMIVVPTGGASNSADGSAACGASSCAAGSVAGNSAVGVGGATGGAAGIAGCTSSRATGIIGGSTSGVTGATGGNTSYADGVGSGVAGCAIDGNTGCDVGLTSLKQRKPHASNSASKAATSSSYVNTERTALVDISIANELVAAPGSSTSARSRYFPFSTVPPPSKGCLQGCRSLVSGLCIFPR